MIPRWTRLEGVKDQTKVWTICVGLEKLKETYAYCPDFGLIFNTLQSGPSRDHPDCVLQEGHLFHGGKLCIPRTSVRNFLTWELHTGGLACYLG